MRRRTLYTVAVREGEVVVAYGDEPRSEQASEPTEGFPPLFIVGAVLFFVLLIVIALLLTPAIPIPD
jgi:hypothetical protein